MNARKTSSRGASNSRSVRICGTPGSAVTCISFMTYSFLSDRSRVGIAIDRSLPAAPRAARRAARSSPPRTRGSRRATRSPPSSGSASRWLRRAVAWRVREISPACSSTLRCREIAGCDTVNGAANSATEASPWVSRVRIARRVGSASAPKTASRCSSVRVFSSATGAIYNSLVSEQESYIRW